MTEITVSATETVANFVTDKLAAPYDINTVGYVEFDPGCRIWGKSLHFGPWAENRDLYEVATADPTKTFQQLGLGSKPLEVFTSFDGR